MRTPQAIAADIARELRKHPGHWTQAAPARTAEGASTEARDPHAVCWCLWGQVIKRIPPGTLDEFGVLAAFVDSIDELKDGEGLGIYNDADGRTVDDVIAVCEKVAAAA